MKFFIFFVSMILVACSPSSPYYENTFVEERLAHQWDFESEAFDYQPTWQTSFTREFDARHCSQSLEHYLLYSSDIITPSHTVNLSKKDLSDSCFALAILYLRDVLHAELTHENVHYQLDVSNNPRLTDKSVAYLIEFIHQMPQVKQVDLRGNFRITQDALVTARHETEAHVQGEL